MKYERRHQPLIPFSMFVIRLMRTALRAVLIVAGALLLGVFGYHYFEGLGWLDALLNASMILSGMGPVDALKTSGGKLFASFYAIFSGVMFLTVAAVLFAPVVHRLLHHFHLDGDRPDRS